MSYFTPQRLGFRYRSLVRITDPAVEPVTLSEAKAHLRVDEDFLGDDLYIQGLISAARHHIETVSDRTLIRSQWQMKFDLFPSRDIPLPRPPVASGPITLSYVPINGGLPVSVSGFLEDRDSTPGVIRPQWNDFWPNARGAENDITVTYWAGYGNSPHNVPTPARHCALMLCGHWYANRESVIQGGMNPVPQAVEILLGAINWGQYR